MSKLNIGNDLYLKGRIGWQGLSKDEYLSEGEYKIINATALMDGYVDWNNCGYITKERYEEAKEIMLQEGDILISKDGTLGKIGFVKNLTTPCSVASGIFVLRNTKPDVVNFDYLYHILKSHIFKDFINRNKSLGSTIPHLYQRDLANFELELPSIDEQKKVATILNSLDLKIRNNEAVNLELESMTKTIYDYWFLQFEFPNEEGKPYKSSGGKMVWSDELKREIPEGWKVENLGDICEFSNGINYDKNDPGDTQYKIVNVRNITASSLILDDSDFDVLKLRKSLGDKYIVNDGDILIARSGTPGAVRLLENPDGKTIYCGFIICGKPYNRNHKLLITYSLKQLEGTSATKTGGSILQNVSQETLKVIKVVIPNRFVLDKFNQTIQKNINMIVSKTKENQELASLRDFLLPMLMNGQVAFKEEA